MDTKQGLRIYKLWFEFLRRCDQYRKQVETGRGGRVYRDFGDIYSVDFDEWWDGHRDLFSDKLAEAFNDLYKRIGIDPSKSSGIQLTQSVEDYEEDRKLGWVVVSVNLASTKNQLVHDFENFLKCYYTHRKGRPKLKRELVSIAYPLIGRPNVPALEIMLDVYDLRKSDESLKLYGIGEKLRLNPKQMPKRGDTKKMTSDKRRVMTATVSRYFRHAEKIIENVSKGVFPKHD